VAAQSTKEESGIRGIPLFRLVSRPVSQPLQIEFIVIFGVLTVRQRIIEDDIFSMDISIMLSEVEVQFA
jgi:hypothetical protein